MNCRQACHMNGRRAWARGSHSWRFEQAAARKLDFGDADGSGDFPANSGLEKATDGGLAAIPPNSYVLSAGLGGIMSGDFLAAGHKNKQRKLLKKTNKTKRGEWAPLTVLVWSSVTVHTAGRNTETRINSK